MDMGVFAFNQVSHLLPAMPYGFQRAGLSPPWLNLFPDTFLFLMLL